MMTQLMDLHIHYGGAIPPLLIFKFLVEDGYLSTEYDEVQKAMTYYDDNVFSFENFLNKFKILDYINWSEERIYATSDAIVKNLTNNNVVYAEIRFTIDKYRHYLNMSTEELIRLIIDSLKVANTKYGITTAPILGLKYGSTINQSEIIEVATNISELAGLDIVGDEQYFNADIYEPIFCEWRKANKGLTIHVGETQSFENIKVAIERLKVNRIAHGISAINNRDVMQLAIDNDVSFDIALTSNHKTGVVKDLSQHPIHKLLDFGCAVTLGTDDPAIFNTSISNEYSIAKNVVGLNDDQLANIKTTAANQAFTQYPKQFLQQNQYLQQ